MTDSLCRQMAQISKEPIQTENRYRLIDTTLPALRCCMVWYGAVWCAARQRRVVWCEAIWCGVVYCHVRMAWVDVEFCGVE